MGLNQCELAKEKAESGMDARKQESQYGDPTTVLTWEQTWLGCESGGRASVCGPAC